MEVGELLSSGSITKVMDIGSIISTLLLTIAPEAVWKYVYSHTAGQIIFTTSIRLSIEKLTVLICNGKIHIILRRYQEKCESES